MFYVVQSIFYIAILLIPAFLITYIGYFNNIVQNAIICGTPLLFILYHQLAKMHYKKDFHFDAYLPAIFGVAIYFALGSCSQSELVEIGFKIQSASAYLSTKFIFHFWAIVLLPVVLGKFLRT